MPRVMLDDVRAAVLLGEGQRLEFKAEAPLDGAYKNTICREIAAMANGGGGRLILGVSDGQPAKINGLAMDTARAITQAGYVQKLMAERMVPQPEIEVQLVEIDADHAVVAIDVTAPWLSSQPRFMPVVLTRDVQDGRGRVVAAAGAILVRVHDQCLRVQGFAEWDQVMRPILDRYREFEVRPMLTALLNQRLLDAAPAAGRSELVDASFDDLSGRIERLREPFPAAAYYDCRLVLDGVSLTREQQRELIERSAAPRPGWSTPPYVSGLVLPAERGALEFKFRRPGQPAEGWTNMIHQFWLLSPEGRFVSVHLDHVDLDRRGHQAHLPAPGPDRPLDPVTVAWEVLGFVEFAANVARKVQPSALWAEFTLANVLERSISKRINPGEAIVDRVGPWPLGWPRSNRERLTVSGSFDPRDLVAGWRNTAVDWNGQVFGAFGWDIDADTVTRLHQRMRAE